MLLVLKSKLTMKNLSKALILLFVCSCSSYDYVVESDYSYEGDFNKYDSFNFIANKNFSGTDNEKVIIEKYLKSTLNSWGYDHKERRPGLLILYTVFYEDFEYNGFDQPQFQGWLKANYSDKEVVFKKDTLPDGSVEEAFITDGRYFRESYEKVSYSLKEGTIMISLFDRKKHKTVWQGYASGVFGGDNKKNERIMRSAIIRIMDEFKLLAFDA